MSTQMVDLPAEAVEDTWRQNRDIRIFAGRELTKYESTSDGYNPVPVAHTVHMGVLMEFSSEYVGGFADGLKRLGAAIPAAS